MARDSGCAGLPFGKVDGKVDAATTKKGLQLNRVRAVLRTGVTHSSAIKAGKCVTHARGVAGEVASWQAKKARTKNARLRSVAASTSRAK